MTLLCAQAQMGSIVTVPWGPVNIRSLKELMESDLNLKAHWKILDSLWNSSDDPVIGEVLARVEPVRKVTELVDELKSQRKRNFAYLMYRRSMQFYASQSVSSLASSVLKQIRLSGNCRRKDSCKKYHEEHGDCFALKRTLIKNVIMSKTWHVVMLQSNLVMFLAKKVRLFNF